MSGVTSARPAAGDSAKRSTVAGRLGLVSFSPSQQDQYASRLTATDAVVGETGRACGHWTAVRSSDVPTGRHNVKASDRRR